ncbi:MAG: Protein of unknown function (DUF1800) [bacterium]|nr:MAG: Protein of unknown function (DUF1800) [bacterium]
MCAVEWNDRTVAHMLRRVGFGATQEDIKFYLDMGQSRAINYIINYESIDDSEVDRQVASANLDLTKTTDLILWWVIRMTFTKRLLQEKMVFFWHDHFATAIFKVKEEDLMLKQNQLFRQFALGNFEAFLLEVSKDPAMIIWLDNFTNKKGQPNENYARELNELFSMGVGNYTENDVKEAARAFTGWSINRRTKEFSFETNQHDFGTKTFLSETGALNGDDIVRIIAARQATARFISKKLFEYFVFQNPKDSTIDKLANVYLSNGFSIKAVMQAILTSEEFFSEKAFNAIVKSPVENIVGTLRMLKAKLDTRGKGGDIISSLTAQGQTLFNPPSVSGWDGDIEWINTSTLLNRFNFSNILTSNRATKGSTIDPKVLIGSSKIATSKEVVNFFLKQLALYDVDSATNKTLRKYLDQNDDGSKGKFTLNDSSIDKKVRGLIHLILTLPDYQFN